MSFRKEILKIHIPTPTDCPAQSVFFCVKTRNPRKKPKKNRQRSNYCYQTRKITIEIWTVISYNNYCKPQVIFLI